MLDSDWNVVAHVDILDDQCSVRSLLVNLIDSLDTNWSVADLGVQEYDGSDCLTWLATICHVDTNTTVLDVEVVQVPEPVPVHEDSRLATVELHVTTGELL